MDGAFVKKDVLVLNGKIVGFEKGCCVFDDVKEYDCDGCYLVPGFIDIHTHGACGVDVNRAKAPDFEKLAAFYASKGTTSFFASVLSDSVDNTLRILDEIARFTMIQNSGAQLLGAHLEGPFLSKEKKGAMPEKYLKAADIELFEQYASSAVAKYITIAPEIEGALDLIPPASKKMVVGIGHSAADYDTTVKAIEGGTKIATHTFNGMRGLDRVEPAILGAVLEEDIYTEVIADGRHVHPANVHLLYRLKGNKRIIAITDSIEAAGLADGQYHLGDNSVTLQGEDAFISGTDTRAGSVLSMDKALHNMMRFLNIPLETALPMFTENPADVFKLNKGYMRIGYDADLLVLDKNYTLLHTFVGGKAVFSAQ